MKKLILGTFLTAGLIIAGTTSSTAQNNLKNATVATKKAQPQVAEKAPAPEKDVLNRNAERAPIQKVEEAAPKAKFMIKPVKVVSKETREFKPNTQPVRKD